jgi:hypothetical protein
MGGALGNEPLTDHRGGRPRLRAHRVAACRCPPGPTDGLADQFPSAFVVASSPSDLLGSAGLEVYETSGILRSLAVAASAQKTGVGRALIENPIGAARAAWTRPHLSAHDDRGRLFRAVRFPRRRPRHGARRPRIVCRVCACVPDVRGLSRAACADAKGGLLPREFSTPVGFGQQVREGRVSPGSLVHDFREEVRRLRLFHEPVRSWGGAKRSRSLDELFPGPRQGAAPNKFDLQGNKHHTILVKLKTTRSLRLALRDALNQPGVAPSRAW